MPQVKPDGNKTTVIIPVYNHGATVAAVIAQVLSLHLPVIVVDDGSTDNTYQNIRSIPGIRILRHKENRGKGAALVTGMTAAAADNCRWAVTIDADGQHNPADIPGLLEGAITNPGSIVIGHRTEMAMAPWTSRFGRKFSNFWLRISGAPPLADTQSGFRVYPLPDVLQLGVKARRYQYELEVLAKAAWRGIPIVEIPVGVTYLPPGQRISHFRPGRDFLRNTQTFSRLITGRLFSPFLGQRRFARNPKGMTAYFYAALTTLSAWVGDWFFALISRGIAAGYFVFAHRRRRVSIDFYAALFPGKSVLYHAWCTFRQFGHFTTVFLDRAVLRQGKEIPHTFDGLENITSSLTTHRGAILLMSHMGNWEVAAHLLKKRLPDLKLLLFMGVRQKEAIEQLQKQAIRADGITVVGMDKTGGSPVEILDAVRFLGRGGAVSLAGDIVWRENQRCVPARLLNRDIWLPEAPYLLSLLSGVPLIIFFAFRTGRRRYRFTASPPIHVTAPTRNLRAKAISAAAQVYADHLETALATHPFQWYHFEPFLKK